MAMSNETMNLTERDNSNFFIRFLKYFIPWKGDKGNEVVRKLVFMCSIVLFCMSISELKKYLTADEKEKSHMQEIVSEYEPKFDDVESQPDDKKDDVEAVSPDSEDRVREIQSWVTDKDLLARNSDVVGWIKIPGFVNSEGDEFINFPVLQGENNDYYLYKDLDKNYYESGSIFADAWSKIDEEGQSDNITIFGHHMGYVGTSFTHLAEYKKGVDFLKEHPMIEFNSIYESGCKYAIVSCFMVNIREDQDDGNPVFEYIGYRNFDDQEHQFDVWYDEIMKRSWYTSDIECTADDKYITLSTCTKEVEDMRWVIVAKKLTADENIDLIAESYEEKPDKDIYFPKCWRNVFGNNKHDSGWEY